MKNKAKTKATKKNPTGLKRGMFSKLVNGVCKPFTNKDWEKLEKF